LNSCKKVKIEHPRYKLFVFLKKVQRLWFYRVYNRFPVGLFSYFAHWRKWFLLFFWSMVSRAPHCACVKIGKLRIRVFRKNAKCFIEYISWNNPRREIRSAESAESCACENDQHTTTNIPTRVSATKKSGNYQKFYTIWKKILMRRWRPWA